MILVTKFMPAGDLFSYLEKQESQPLPEWHVKKIIFQIARGVQCLHRQLIVHRDLKLENIFMSDLTPDAEACIGDFGGSIKMTSPSQMLDYSLGTIGFMAPEVSERRTYSFKCDIFSLGCIMHAMLLAECPFWCEDFEEHKKVLLDESITFEMT